jgi:hypothetical protein
VGTWLARARTTSWEHPLRLMVFPIDADGSPATAAYIAALRKDTFQPIAEFMRSEAQRYGLPQSTPVDVYLGQPTRARPPDPPYGGNALEIAMWSLRLRFWAWRNAQYDGPRPDVRMFVLYHDPERITQVAHSLGLQKGLIGVVYAFASDAQAAQNNVIIAHELLHTVGATDKYEAGSNMPAYPEGYAEPDKDPLLPQEFAEVMGGRIPVTQAEAEIPEGLDQVQIGAATAREINWLR